jgi:hypothetical protein
MPTDLQRYLMYCAVHDGLKELSLGGLRTHADSTDTSCIADV